MTDSLSVAIHAFASRVLMCLSWLDSKHSNARVPDSAI